MITPFDLTQEQADQINVLLPTCEYIVGIRKNETNEVVFCPQDIKWHDCSLFWWTEGNGGCDCNRVLMFLRARGSIDEEFESDDDKCGTDKYTLVGIWFPDGSDIRDLQLLNPS